MGVAVIRITPRGAGSGHSHYCQYRREYSDGSGRRRRAKKPKQLTG